MALPSSRALASEPDDLCGTVTVAYGQLVAEGFIEIRHGARPCVAVTNIGRGHNRSRRAPNAIRLAHYGERLKRVVPRTDESPRRNLSADFQYGHLSAPDFPCWRGRETSLRQSHADPYGRPMMIRSARNGFGWRCRVIRGAAELSDAISTRSSSLPARSRGCVCVPASCSIPAIVS